MIKDLNFRIDVQTKFDFTERGKEMYQNLRAEMVRKNMTAVELGKRIGMSQSAISLKMNGRRKFNFNEAVKIKTALNAEMPLEELFAE